MSTKTVVSYLNKKIPAILISSKTIWVKKTDINDSDNIIMTDLNGYRYKRKITTNNDYFVFEQL